MGKTGSGHVNGWALGNALGVLWAGAVVVLGLSARWGWGAEWRDLLSDVYLGYDSTRKGLALGAIWGFLDAFVGGFLLAWLYNRLR